MNTPCKILESIIKEAWRGFDWTSSKLAEIGLTYVQEDRPLENLADRREYWARHADSRHTDSMWPWNRSSGDTFYLAIKHNNVIIVNANVPCVELSTFKERYDLARKDLLWEIRDDSKNCPTHCGICSLLPKELVTPSLEST